MVRALLLYLSLSTPDPAALEFARVQEDWVAASHEVAHPLPLVFRQLDSNRYRERATARLLIETMGFSASRGVIRARHHRSVTVRDTANALYNAYFLCRACRGTGVCPLCKSDYDYKCPCDRQLCVACRGSGDLRLRAGMKYWNGEQWVREVVEVDLYGNRNASEGQPGETKR